MNDVKRKSDVVSESDILGDGSNYGSERPLRGGQVQGAPPGPGPREWCE